MARNGEMKTYQEKVTTLRQLMIKSEQQILKALPRQLDSSRMFRVYLTAVQTTPGLVDCDPLSVLGSVLQSAQFGLSLDTVLGESFLIPRWNKHRGCKVAQFQIGYKGYVKLMRNADKDLRDVFAHTVHENDVFEWELGMEPIIKAHRPPLTNRGEPVAAYAVAVWQDSYKRFELVDQEQIERVLSSSDSYQRAKRDGGDSPWLQHKPAMYRKTALRQLGNRMPLSAESDLAKAMTNEIIDGQTFLQGGGNAHEIVGTPATTGDVALPEASQDPLDAAAERAEAQGGGDEKPKPRRSRRGNKKKDEAAPAQQAPNDAPNPRPASQATAPDSPETADASQGDQKQPGLPNVGGTPEDR
jgi:recombination protein RecT